MNKKLTLRYILTGNAAFSFLSGIILITIPSYISEILGISNNTILLIIGSGLLFFVISIAFILSQKKINMILVKAVIQLDWVWVAGSVILLLLNPFKISNMGNFLIGVVAAIVMMFAILQMKTRKSN